MLSPEATLLGAKMLFVQTQRVAMLDIVNFELVQAASRLLGDFSVLSQMAACFVLLSVLSADESCQSSLSDALVELKSNKQVLRPKSCF